MLKTLALLAAPLVLAGAPSARLFDPPQANDAPSAFACSTQTLVQGKACVFEARSPAPADAAAQARANVEAVTRLSDVLCAEAGPTQARCRSSIAEVAQGCSLGGRAALVDQAGRFVPEAQACYQALADAQARVTMLKSTAAPCCQCLAAHHCVAQASQCIDGFDRAQAAPAANGACAVGACADACAGLLPDATPAVTARKP
jgi:hypothetical protein